MAAVTAVVISLESHLIGFAAEQARLRSQVVELRSFREALGRGSAAS